MHTCPDCSLQSMAHHHRSRLRRPLTALWAACTVVLTALLLLMANHSAIASAQAGEITVHVKQASLAQTCTNGTIIGAHFVINQIDSPPASISVTTSDGRTTTVALTFTSGPVGHYVMSLSAGVTVTDATAVLPVSWTGQFNLSNYECSNGASEESSAGGPPVVSSSASSSGASSSSASSSGASSSGASSSGASSSGASSSGASSSSAAVSTAPGTSASGSASGGTVVNAPLPPGSSSAQAGLPSASQAVAGTNAGIVNAPLPPGANGSTAVSATNGVLGATGPTAVMLEALMGIVLLAIGAFLSAHHRMKRHI